MGGSCICLNIKKNCISPPNFEINTPNYKNNLQNKNDQSSLNKNNISSITNKKGNALFNTEEEKDNMSFNDINTANENYISSENSNKKDNNLLPINNQNYNNLTNSQINNEILCNNSPYPIINVCRVRSSLIDGVENVESATPKVGKIKLEDKTKAKKKVFSHFCQNK